MEKNGRVDAVAYCFDIRLNGDGLDNIEYVYITEKARDNLDEMFKNLGIDPDICLYKDEDVVQDQYFTQDKINELKLRFIKYITETPNPFSIYCNDGDSYPVPADKIFDISVNVNPEINIENNDSKDK